MAGRLLPCCSHRVLGVRPLLSSPAASLGKGLRDIICQISCSTASPAGIVLENRQLQKKVLR